MRIILSEKYQSEKYQSEKYQNEREDIYKFISQKS